MILKKLTKNWRSCITLTKISRRRVKQLRYFGGFQQLTRFSLILKKGINMTSPTYKEQVLTLLTPSLIFRMLRLSLKISLGITSIGISAKVKIWWAATWMEKELWRNHTVHIFMPTQTNHQNFRGTLKNSIWMYNSQLVHS